MTEAVVPFRLEVPQAVLDDLHDRLDRTRWPDELPGVGKDYGVPLDNVRKLAEYWRSGYDWRAHEARLNEFPQFTTEIDGTKVHFLHVRSANPDALPVILTHGWPGSVVEFLDVIDELSEFHLVIPTLPGYGLSGPTVETGWDVTRIARAWAELMSRLGYDRYGAQGGDWGSVISLELAVVAPERVVGVHVNFLPPSPSDEVTGLSEKDNERLASFARYLAEPAGYARIQATRPQTLAYGLTDSPVGQLAWIAEKFADWTDPDCPIDADRLLTNVMLYWVTATAGSSARLYYESAARRGRRLQCPAPLGVAVFPYDLVLPVAKLAEQRYNLVHWTEFSRGGHFAAMEVPDLFVADVRAFFGVSLMRVTKA